MPLTLVLAFWFFLLIIIEFSRPGLLISYFGLAFLSWALLAAFLVEKDMDLLACLLLGVYSASLIFLTLVALNCSLLFKEVKLAFFGGLHRPAVCFFLFYSWLAFYSWGLTTSLQTSWLDLYTIACSGQPYLFFFQALLLRCFVFELI
jgi:hypothetical protein